MGRHGVIVLVGALAAVGCGGSAVGGADGGPADPGDGGAVGDGASEGDGGAGGGAGTDGGAADDGGAIASDAGAVVQAVEVRLVPAAGTAGMQRVVFGLPLPPGLLTDADDVCVTQAGAELAAARSPLASHPDGSLRSVQIQLDVMLEGEATVRLEVGSEPTVAAIEPVTVESTLDPADGTEGPAAWAILPASWLAASGIVGPMLTDDDSEAAGLAAWDGVCDYERFDADAFIANMSSRGAWLYDRPTALYRGYARSGELGPLQSAYREAAIYRAALTGTGTDTRIGVPTAEGDLKYHYAQGMALHYLLTGDVRFREAAEDVATRAHALWPSPGYAGGADFWTERHAGFGLLAYVWAARVSDDRASELLAWADEALDAYLEVQADYPSGYADTEARCFAHSADAHGEGYGYFGCSPWMSAILADALDAYATERGGEHATRARESIVKLGRIVARDGLDASGKPYYWMGVGTDADEVDAYDEHWGEGAYVVAMAWHHAGRSDDALRSTALALVDGLRANGSAPHLRSMNWQCRSAVATPWFLAE